MRLLITAAPLLVLLTACGGPTSSTPASAAAPTPESPTEMAPPPPPCVYLTEATVLSYFDAGVQLPMPGHRSPAVFSSCQYDLEGKDWSGTLLLEMPEPGKQQAIIDEVAGAKGVNKVDFTNASGKFTNEGRILSVAGGKYFRIKFSALPKGDAPAPFDEAARRKLLQQMAAGILMM